MESELSNIKKELNGLDNIKYFAVINIVVSASWLIASALLFYFYNVILSVFDLFTAIQITTSTLLGLLFLTSILLLISTALLRSSLKILKEIYYELKICYYGSNVALIGLIITFISIISYAVSLLFNPQGINFYYFSFLGISVILSLIGWLLAYVWGSFKFQRIYNDILFSVVGIIFLASIFLPLLYATAMELVSFTLLYISIRKPTIKLLRIILKEKIEKIPIKKQEIERLKQYLQKLEIKKKNNIIKENEYKYLKTVYLKKIKEINKEIKRLNKIAS